jgi:hypothetical protein
MCEERVARILVWMHEQTAKQGGHLSWAYYEEDRLITDEGDTLGPDYQWHGVSQGEWLQIMDELGVGAIGYGGEPRNVVEVRHEDAET